MAGGRQLLVALVALGACRFDSAGPGESTADAGVGPDAASDAGAGTQARCPPGPALPPGATVVSDVDQLAEAAASAGSGDVIAVADGTYDLSQVGTISIDAEGVTLRSESGDRDSVVLTGAGSLGRMLAVRASNVEVAHLMLRDSTDNAIFVQPSGAQDIVGVRLHDLVLRDHTNADIQIRGANGAAGPFADDGTVSCSLFEVSSGFHGSACNASGNAVDGEHVRGWNIAGNTFLNQYCDSTYARTVMFEGNSRDVSIVGNTFINNMMNIFLGDAAGFTGRSYPDARPAECGANIHHTGGVVCNNVMVGLGLPDVPSNTDFEEGVAMWRVCDTWVTHNTIVGPPGGETFSTIEYRFSETFVHVANNLLSEGLNDRGGRLDSAFAGTDVVVQDVASTFVQADGNDVHLATQLAPGADIDGIAALAACATRDMDGQPRDPTAPTPGAYEPP